MEDMEKNHPDNKDIRISKTLSWLLRHSCISEGLKISSDGYVDVNELLQHKKLQKLNCNVDDICRIVQQCKKQRFNLENKDGVLKICANQGHSIPVNNLTLFPVSQDENIEVIHGTYFKNWNSIKTEGLKCRGRNHIHFSTSLPGKNTTNFNISGIRFSSEIYIYIDFKKAITESGIKFVKSVNSVILSSGNKDGIIPTKYFSKVIKASDGSSLEV